VGYVRNSLASVGKAISTVDSVHQSFGKALASVEDLAPSVGDFVGSAEDFAVYAVWHLASHQYSVVSLCPFIEPSTGFCASFVVLAKKVACLPELGLEWIVETLLRSYQCKKACS